MRGRIYIPQEVKQSILDHIRRAVDSAIETFASAAEDEDTMTGHFGSKLQTGVHVVDVPNPEIGGRWRWSIDYYKFKGRGPKPTEFYLGADGIFMLRLDHGARVDSKSLLFQAKMGDAGGKALLEQCIKLSTWREAAFVLAYSPLIFQAATIDDCIEHRGGRQSFASTRPAANFLGEDFLNCEVGDDELYYDSTHRRLIWRADSGERVAVRFSVRHRLRINVKAPPRKDATPDFDREIKPDEIPKYRMKATSEEILAIGTTPKTFSLSLKDTQRRLALAYHPDHFSNLGSFFRDLLNRRMQEVNDAHADLKGKGRKKP